MMLQPYSKARISTSSTLIDLEVMVLLLCLEVIVMCRETTQM